MQQIENGYKGRKLKMGLFVNIICLSASESDKGIFCDWVFIPYYQWSKQIPKT